MSRAGWFASHGHRLARPSSCLPPTARSDCARGKRHLVLAPLARTSSQARSDDLKQEWYSARP